MELTIHFYLGESWLSHLLSIYFQEILSFFTCNSIKQNDQNCEDVSTARAVPEPEAHAWAAPVPKEDSAAVVPPDAKRITARAKST